MPHLIVSVGRTGTQWLAACMGWPHEPIKFVENAVSPRHLYLMTFSTWRPPQGTKIAVVTRNAQDQVLSATNRWKALGNYETRKRDWLRRLPRYIETLDRLVSEGAGLLCYRRLTFSEPSMTDDLRHAGMPAPLKFETRRFNTFPKVLTELDPQMRVAADRLSEAYRKWHDSEA